MRDKETDAGECKRERERGSGKILCTAFASKLPFVTLKSFEVHTFEVDRLIGLVLGRK